MSNHDIASSSDTTQQKNALSSNLTAASTARLNKVWRALVEAGTIPPTTAVTGAAITAALSREQIQGVLAKIGQI